MLKKYRFLLFLLFLIYSLSANAHVQHYSNLNKIEFDIYRNNKHIGKHIFSFEKIENKTIVRSLIDFKISKLGVTLYKYNAEGLETYLDGNLVNFTSSTDQNGKKKYVNIKVQDDEYLIDGSSYKGSAPIEFLIGTWWNHSIVKAPAQISAVSGRVIKQKVTFLGKEKLNLDGK